MGEVGQAHRPRAATALVMDPRNGEVLAPSNWPRVDANDIGSAPVLRAPEPRRGRELRAGVDLQGLHRGGRARGGADQAEHPVRPAPADPGGRPQDRRGPRSRRRDPHVSPRSSRPNVGSVMIGLKLGMERFDKWVRRFGSAAHRHRPAPARRAESCQSRGVLRLVAGRHPDRAGAGGHAPADGVGYSAIANGGVMHRPHVIAGEAAAGAGSCRVGRGKVSRMLEGCWPRAARRRRRRCRGTSSGKTARPRSPTRRTALLGVQVLLVLHRVRPCAQPAPERRRDGGRAGGPDRRRRGGGSGFRADRRVRAPLPAHPAEIVSSGLEALSRNRPGDWDEVFRTASPGPLWRRHSDAVNSALVHRWLAGRRVARALKTDLWDEAVADGGARPGRPRRRGPRRGRGPAHRVRRRAAAPVAHGRRGRRDRAPAEDGT